jgi:hypothetical protein
MITNHLGRCLRQFSAKFSPVTLPSLMHKVWRKIAKRFDMRTTKRWENLVAAPAMVASQQQFLTSYLNNLHIEMKKGVA